ncbi:MAG: CAP domain-containing protein, partial [Candidatus Falkowbacteria bacterium]|nr:CAP domain-containing protein [Candidatus Falkowbacteria bacterium]
MKQPKNKLFYTFIFSLLLVTGIFLLPKIAYLAGVDAKQIIALTNNERQQAGIKPLNASPLLALALAAENKAQAIVRSQLFQHNFPTKKFSNWIAETGYSYRYVGENLALNFLTNEGIINAWLNSPPHLNNLLNKNFS